MRELTMGSDPAPAGNVGNGDTVADKEARGGLCEVFVHGAVEAACFVGVTVDSILDLFWGISF